MGMRKRIGRFKKVDNFLSRLHLNTEPVLLPASASKIGGIDMPSFIDKNGTSMTEVFMEHYKDFRTKRELYAATHYHASFEEYFSTPESFVSGSWLISGRQLSKDVRRSLPLTVQNFLDAAGPRLTKMFAGRRGCFAHLHYDEDFCPSAHILLTGRKTIWLFDPDVTGILSATCNWGKFGPLELDSEAGKEDLLRHAEYKIILEPGDVLAIPPCFWHAVFYEEDSIGISARFSGLPVGAMLAQTVHSSPLKMLIAWDEWCQRELRFAQKNCIRKIQLALSCDDLTPLGKFKAIRHSINLYPFRPSLAGIDRLRRISYSRRYVSLILNAAKKGWWY